MRILPRARHPRTGDWKPSAEILDAETGKTLVSLKLVTDEEDTLLKTIKIDGLFQVSAMAFSPDASVLAVGTNVGQAKLFNVRTGELIRALDDEQEKGHDQWTSKLVKRAMGSVEALSFSPDGSLLATCGEHIQYVTKDGCLLLIYVANLCRLKVWDVKPGRSNTTWSGRIGPARSPFLRMGTCWPAPEVRRAA